MQDQHDTTHPSKANWKTCLEQSDTTLLCIIIEAWKKKHSDDFVLMILIELEFSVD